MNKTLAAICILGILPTVLPTAGCRADRVRGPAIDSLEVLATESLRERSYSSTIRVEQKSSHWPHDSYIASYDTDGLRVYTRIDVPATAPPEAGYPVVVFLHGWAGIERAPAYDFYFAAHDDYREMVDAYVESGFVVLVPGWRGHGTVDSKLADGIEFMKAFDNGSYLSPVFYAIDVLNLIDGLQTVDVAPLDLENINLSSHSQGGDVALITLAVAGEGSALRNRINAASIWAGTFPSRFTQVHTYHSMESSPEAFMSGDGSWTASAAAEDGSINPNFIFGYPSDWIETIDKNEWTWQNDTWSKQQVHEAVSLKFTQMYEAINRNVADISSAKYSMNVNEDGTFDIDHDPRVARAMAKIGGFDFDQFLLEPLVLQHSDRDFYSFPQWNADLCARINAAGGQCFDFEYPGNTHALRVSSREWFSGSNSRAGFAKALARDIALFRRENPYLVVAD